MNNTKNSLRLKKNDIIDLKITDISVNGAGIGRYEGQVVFVSGALPEETIKAKIIKTKKSFSIGLLQEIIIPSKHRIEPFCTVFKKCGGCKLQHLSYEQQLNYKANYIKECFSRIGDIDLKMPNVIPSDKTEQYRNKAAFSVAEINGKLESGFYAPHSHRVVPSYCAVQHHDVNRVKEIIVKWADEKNIQAYDETTGKGTMRHVVIRRTSAGEIMAGLVTANKIADNDLVGRLKQVNGLKSIVQNMNNKNTNAILGGRTDTVFGDDYITERYEGLSFKVSLTSFLQINYEQTIKLYNTALKFAGIQKNDVVFDLFCGIGTITLLAAKQAKKVVGIEYVDSAVQNAVRNAELNGITNAQFLAGDAGKMIDKAIKTAGKPSVVILDPPRKGCDKSLIEKLTIIKPERIVYVSCNPATLARDAAILKSSGYTLKELIGVDMFPHTTHIECCCLFTNIKE